MSEPFPWNTYYATKDRAERAEARVKELEALAVLQHDTLVEQMHEESSFAAEERALDVLANGRIVLAAALTQPRVALSTREEPNEIPRRDHPGA